MINVNGQIEMAGFKDTTLFLNTITPEVEDQVKQQAANAPVDPTSEAAKMYAEVEKSKAELKAQSDAAKNQLDREKMAVENERKQLELQQKANRDNAEIALKELKLYIDAANQDKKSSSAQLDSIMNAIKSLQDVAKSGINSNPQQ